MGWLTDRIFQNVLQRNLSGLWGAFKVAHDAFVHFVAKLGLGLWQAWLAFSGLIATFLTLFVWSLQQLSASMAEFDLAEIEAGSASLLEYGAFINRFVPLVEAFSMAYLLFTLWVAVTVFRWIKSFIPTLSN